MEFNPVTLETISQWFLESLSPNPDPRRRAEASLYAAADRPGFALSVLQLASSPAAEDQIRLAAAVHFKNHLRSRWPPTASPAPIDAAEKDQIKSLIVGLMIASPSPLIRSQLSESLSVISSHDFPHSWPSLLPEIVSSLRSAIAAADYSAANGLLSAASSLFTKFRHSFDNTALRLDLKYCLDTFAAPLLETFLATARHIAGGLSSPPEALRPLFESQRLCCDIFYSLNSVELPEFFEDNIKHWMDEFLTYLTATYPPALETDGTVDALRAAVCDNLQLYIEKNEEEFRGYLQSFATAVWTLLLSPIQTPSRDQLTITAIKFLTTVSTSVHHALFAGALQQICESIVFPNIRLREEDEELFEMNHVEFIRRDIEGSDIDTRRRTACELLKGLAVNYLEPVRALVLMQVQNMLTLYGANPEEGWKEKDSAIYLMISLSVKSNLMDAVGFFKTVVVPELQADDVNSTPMLKAGALKFFTVFREQIAKHEAIVLLPSIIRFLTVESNVVHSYAANCIEKLLLVKDGNGPRYVSSDVDPILQPLMENLFKCLQFQESQENPYVMKCIMRVLGVATLNRDIAKACIALLASVLGEVCKNPKNPVFNHYLFEAIAAVIGRSRDPTLVSEFEGSLFPVLQSILGNDITEFWPYAFQIFAQLVETSRTPLSGGYMAIFGVLLLQETWRRSANAPALVRLLQAYLQKMPNELGSNERLSEVLGIFKSLISATSTEVSGFYVLNTVVENIRYDTLAPFMHEIWATLFKRLETHQRVKFVNPLVIFMSLVLVKYGPGVLIDSINRVQGNIFMAILQKFWIPNLKLISGSVEMKLVSVASTRLITESPVLLDPSASELWGKMLDSIISLLAKSNQEREELENDTPDIPENVGYSATFSRLHNARKKEEDPLKEIGDPKEFLVTSLARLSAHSPGRYTVVIDRYVDPSNQAALVQLAGAYNCTIS